MARKGGARGAPKRKWSREAHVALLALQRAAKKSREFVTLSAKRRVKEAGNEETRREAEADLRGARGCDPVWVAEHLASGLAHLTGEVPSKDTSSLSAERQRGLSIIIEHKTVREALKGLRQRAAVPERRSDEAAPRGGAAGCGPSRDGKGAIKPEDEEEEEPGDPADPAVAGILGKLRAAAGGRGTSDEDDEAFEEGEISEIDLSDDPGSDLGSDRGRPREGVALLRKTKAASTKQKPKNRMGQRARKRLQALAEGRPDPRRERPRGRQARDPPEGGRIAARGSPIAAPSDLPADVHPSWVAKMRQQQLLKASMFDGPDPSKKIVFD